MKLLFLNHNTAWSGTFFRAYHLARALARRGHEVTLVTTRRSGAVRSARWTRDGVSVIEAPDLMAGPARQGWDPWNTIYRLGALARGGGAPDVVHAFDSRPVVVLPALRAQRALGARLVMDWADWWGRGGTIQERSGWTVRTFFGPVETWFEEAFRRSADWTTVISRALAERAVALGVPRERILYLPQGCEVDELRPLDRAAARAALGLEPAEPWLVHLGVLNRGDAALLFDALRRVRETLPEAKLALLGRPRVPVPAELLAAGAVRPLGFVDFEPMRLWLAAADAGVIPLRDTLSNRARWPSKINDYLAMGLPPVLPAVGDAAELVRLEACGTTTSASADGLADGLVAALSDPAARVQQGARARVVAEEKLAWRHIAARLEACYRELPGSSMRTEMSA
jgi:glycosyltransferase involved in cell wall biosynthesis